MGIEIDCAFPGGNIVLERIEEDRVFIRQDRRDTVGFWFYWYFRVRGAAGRTLRFEFTDGPVVGVRGPGVSLDEGANWFWAGAEQATDRSFVYSFGPEDDCVRFSLGMPYTLANWEAFKARIGDRPGVRSELLCHSRQGRPVEVLYCGQMDGSAETRVAITCRHHCCEMMASYQLEGLIEAVLTDDGCAWLREHAELLIVPFVDPDGVEAGDQGKNRAPHDHGRDYREDQIYPETRAIRTLLPKWSQGRRLAVLDLHCPGHRGKWHEHIYQVGSADPDVWAGQQRFGRILESCRQGPLPYGADGDLPFGVAWNTTSDARGGVGLKKWAGGLPGVVLCTGFEIPYANAAGAEVNPDSARALGRDIARALSTYLEQSSG